MRAAAPVLVLLSLLAACDAADEDAIRPLPPLARLGPEARLGLPEVQGSWYFAGWDVPIADPPDELPAPGELRIEAQRLDSIAGVYLAGERRLPFVGEVRRDSIFALVTSDQEAGRRYLAGRARRDTLWLEVTSLGVAQAWPAGTRAAFVREAPERPFVRLPGGVYRIDEPEVVEEPEDPAAAEDTVPAPAPSPAPQAAPAARPDPPADTATTAPREAPPVRREPETRADTPAARNT